MPRHHRGSLLYQLNPWDGRAVHTSPSWPSPANLVLARQPLSTSKVVVETPCRSHGPKRGHFECLHFSISPEFVGAYAMPTPLFELLKLGRRSQQQ